jgi:hypothetical protein
VLVAQGVATAGGAGELDQPLVVPGKQGVVLLQHQQGVGSAGGVVDDCAQTGGPAVAFSAVAGGGVVDSGPDASSDDRGGNRPLAGPTLVVFHVQPPLTR